MCAHRVGELHRHVAEPAEADDADLLARSRLPVAQRRIGGDAGAQERRCRGGVEIARHLEREALRHHDVAGIAAEGVAAEHGVRAVIGGDGAARAILLQSLFAARAGAAGIDQAADRGEVADLEAGHRIADGEDAPDDLVTGDARILRAWPLAADGVQVGMADAAIEDLDGDVLRTGVAAVEGVGQKRLGGIVGGVAGAGEHGGSLVDAARREGRGVSLYGSRRQSTRGRPLILTADAILQVRGIARTLDRNGGKCGSDLAAVLRGQFHARRP